MSDLKLLASLRKEIAGGDPQEYLVTNHRQNLKAIEDGFRRTKKTSDALRALIGAQGLRNYAISSSSSGVFLSTSFIFVDVTNLSVEITTTGRPVMITLLPTTENVTLGSIISSEATGGTLARSVLSLVRDSTAVGYASIESASGANSLTGVPPSSVFFFDVPAAGTYTYKIQGKSDTNDTLRVFYCKLLAMEW